MPEPADTPVIVTTDAIRTGLLDLFTHGALAGIGDTATLTEIAEARVHYAERRDFGPEGRDLDRIDTVLRIVGDLSATVARPVDSYGPRGELVRLTGLALAWLAALPPVEEPDF